MFLNVSILGEEFIGGNLLSSCLNRQYAVRVLDRNSCPQEIASSVQWTRGSFNNPDDVARAVQGAEVVFHLISNTVPGDYVDENEEVFSNVFPTITLLKICVKANIKRVIFVSSSSVYGLKSPLPISE